MWRKQAPRKAEPPLNSSRAWPLLATFPLGFLVDVHFRDVAVTSSLLGKDGFGKPFGANSFSGLGTGHAAVVRKASTIPVVQASIRKRKPARVKDAHLTLSSLSIPKLDCVHRAWGTY